MSGSPFYAGSCFSVLGIAIACAAPHHAMAVDEGKPNPKITSKTGILVMAHGGDAKWNAAVESVIQPLRSKYPIELALGMAQTSAMRGAVQRLEQQGVDTIAVVRMFISGDSFVPATEYILGLRDQPPADPHSSRGFETGAAAPCPGHDNHGDHAHDGGHGGHHMEKPEPISSRSRFILSQAGVGDSPIIEEILYERAKALSVDPARESILILAHGPGHDKENEQWLTAMNQRIERIGQIGPFRAIRSETLREDWPDRRVEAEKRIRDFVAQANEDGGRCIVLPFRVAGFGPYREVLQGLPYVADGKGFCPHPLMTEWIEQSAKKCFAAANQPAGQ